MKKLFLVLGLAVVLLASCCNNNNQKGAQKCDGQKVEACEGHNHDGAACEKKCDKTQKCEGQKAEACQGHNHEGCNHQHEAAK